MAAALLSVPKRYPFVFGVSTATMKTGGVDLLVQKYVEKVDEIDWMRFSVFTAFGFCFTGVWQYTLFVKVMPRLCPGAKAFIDKPIREKIRDTQGLKELAIQNFAENSVNNPLLYFPIFYTIQEFRTKGFEEGRVSNALSKYVANAHEDVPAILSVWVPAQAFNFAFSPMWLRVPFVSFVSALWTGYVSIVRGAEITEQEGAGPAGAEVAEATKTMIRRNTKW